MYNKILVPTDGSDSAKYAFLTAVDLASKLDAEIMLLHTTFTPQAYWGYNLAHEVNISEEEIEQIGNETINETIKDIKTQGVTLSSKLVSGSPGHTIVETAEEEKADLIIMGSHGHGPISGTLIGSVSQKVLAKSNIPVMIVKDPNAYLL